MSTVLCVPQWQGSNSPQAPRLAEGARRTAALIPADRIVTVPVAAADGLKADGVRARAVIADNLRLTRAAVAGIGGPVIVAGGDCSVDLAPIEAAHARYGDALTVLWIDAHPDCYHPTTLPSGSFHAMGVRTLLGDGPAGLGPDRPLKPGQLRLAGVRTGDATEHEYVARAGVRRHGVADLEDVLDGLTGPVYVHLDLDVLEPAEFGATCYPEPDGVAVDRLVALLAGLDRVVGAALTEHAPADGPSPVTESAALGRLAEALPL